MSTQLSWEHVTHEYPPDSRQQTVEADYLHAVCPNCQTDNVVACVIEGAVHMRSGAPCSNCGEDMRIFGALDRALKEGPGKPDRKRSAKEKAGVDPEPKSDIIDPSTLTASVPTVYDEDDTTYAS